MAPTEHITHDQTSPVALHRIISRLLDDHQRMTPHHFDLCPLCQDASTTLDLLADEVPDDVFEAEHQQLNAQHFSPTTIGKS